MATTIDTGARSTWLFSYGAGESDDHVKLYLTAMYELKLSDILPGSPEAKEIEVNYTALARSACHDAVAKIRSWREEGKLQMWREEDEKLEATPVKKVNH